MTLAESISDERAREAAIEVATRWHYARFAIPERFSSSDLLRWFGALLEWFANLYATSRPLWALLVFGLLATALALLGHVIWSIRRAMHASELTTAPAREPSKRRLDLEAEALAGDGRFLDAAHAMHLACVERLVLAHVVALHRHDPNPTLRARLAAARLAEAERREFLRLLDWLEQRWFRDPTPQPRDAELFAAWRALQSQLASAVA